jgi:hypothetical protein
MQKIFHKFLIINGIWLAIVFFSQSAMACSCYPTQTVDKEFAKTPNVVVLKLQSIKQNDGEPVNYFLSVEKIFKGELKADKVLNFTIDSNCSWFFGEEQIGSEFLFYLGGRPAKGEKWVGSICSRSGSVEDKSNDLVYLENEAKLRGRTRLSGRIDKFIQTDNNSESPWTIPLPGRKIRISGNGRNVELVSDKNGFYEIYDLPVGKYRMTLEKVDGYIFSDEKVNYADFEIKPKSHTERDFFYLIDNEISGKIVDKKGQPIEEVCVNLISQKTQKVLTTFSSCTDKNGAFGLTGIPVGTYKIVINKDLNEQGINSFSKSPFLSTFYYPNAKDEDSAAKISVGESFYLRNLRLVPPEMKETVTITGRLVYSDGKPAVNGAVQFIDSKQIAEASDQIFISDFESRTDKKGEFKIKVLKGQSGVLRGVFYSFPSAFKSCPKIDKVLKQNSNKIEQLETNRVEISSAQNRNSLVLKFPFPFCKEAEDR